MKAFRVWIPKFNNAYDIDHYEVVLGESAGKVRYQKYLDLLDVFDSLTIMDIKVLREPSMDNEKPRTDIFGKDSNTIGWKANCRNCHSEESMGTLV